MNKLILLGILVSPSAHAAKTVDETRQVGEYSGVHVGSGIQAKVETGATGPISLRGDDEVLKHVRTEVKDSVLTITMDWNGTVTTSTPTMVTVRLPKATSLGVSGGAQMEAAVPAAESFRVDASGGGRLTLSTAVAPKRFELHTSGGSSVKLAGVETGDASFNLSGGSRASLGGRADNLHAALSGASTLDAPSMKVGILDVEASGHARAEVRVGKSVHGTLSGGSRVRVPPGVDVNIEASGGSGVTTDL